MSEHGPRMDAMKRIQTACAKTPREQYKSLVAQLFLECVFVPLPGEADRSELTSDYSLELTSVICSYA